MQLICSSMPQLRSLPQLGTRRNWLDVMQNCMPTRPQTLHSNKLLADKDTPCVVLKGPAM